MQRGRSEGEKEEEEERFTNISSYKIYNFIIRYTVLSSIFLFLFISSSAGRDHVSCR